MEPLTNPQKIPVNRYRNRFIGWLKGMKDNLSLNDDSEGMNLEFQMGRI